MCLICLSSCIVLQWFCFFLHFHFEWITMNKTASSWWCVHWRCFAAFREKATRLQYYLQLRDNLLHYNQSVTEEKCFLLAGLALQADFGNYDRERHVGAYFDPREFFPAWVSSVCVCASFDLLGEKDFADGQEQACFYAVIWDLRRPNSATEPSQYRDCNSGIISRRISDSQTCHAANSASYWRRFYSGCGATEQCELVCANYICRYLLTSYWRLLVGDRADENNCHRNDRSVFCGHGMCMVGGVTQWLGCRSLAHGLSLMYGLHVTISWVKCPL